MIFVSRREIRLWMVAISVILAIYSTLGMVRDWFQFLESSNWGAGIFIGGCSSILIFVVTQEITKIPRWKEIIVAIGVALTYFLVIKYTDQIEQRIHVITYGVVALLIHAAMLERVTHGHHIPASSLIAMAIAASLGTIDELIQLTLQSRVFALRDIQYNILASVMAVISNIALRR